LTVSELFNTDDGAKLAPSVASVAKAYQYQDEGGRLLYVVHRRQSAGGKKTFRCSRPDGHGGWIHNLDGARRVLYRLPELRGLKIVYVVEGEKDAETLCRLGLPATTNCAGAGSWRADYTEQLRAAGVESVVVLADNDGPGQTHAEAVAESCHGMGLRVRLVRQLPGWPPVKAKHGEDVSDWLAAGHRPEELLTVVDTTEAFTSTNGHQQAHGPWAAALPVAEFLASDESEVPFLDRDQTLAPGALTEYFSPRGAGKTHVLHAKLVALAREGKRVLLLDRDNPRHEIKRRLRAWGAEHAPSLKIMTRDDTPPLTDRAAWEAFPFGEHDVVAVDSLDASAEGVGEQDSTKPPRAIAVLLDLAHRANGPAIVVLGNTTKSGQTGRGSGVIEDRADVVFEIRDVTNFQPTGAKPWWEELPPAARSDWATRATRRKRRDTYRLAFIASKFRLGQEPDPFVLEIDFTTIPWTLRNVTADLVAAGEQAQREAAAEQARGLDAAAAALVAELTRRAVGGLDMPTKGEAETLLVATGMTQKGARKLLADRTGTEWMLTPKDGKTMVVAPLSPGATAKSADVADPHKQRGSERPNSAARMDTWRRDPQARIPAKIAAHKECRALPRTGNAAPAAWAEPSLSGDGPAEPDLVL